MVAKISVGLWIILLYSPVFGQEEKKPISYYGAVSIGFLSGDNLNGSAHVTNGIQLHNRVNLSIGLGIEKYYYNHYMPLFLETSYLLSKKKTTPFLAATGGILQPLSRSNWNSKLETGLTLGLRGGLVHRINKGISFSTDVGFRFSKITEEQYIWWDNSSSLLEYHIQRFELRICLIFNE